MNIFLKVHFKLARTMLNMSQNEVAELTGISARSITAIENGGIVKSTALNMTQASLQKIYEERGVVFIFGEKPGIQYDPNKDVIGYLKNKK